MKKLFTFLTLVVAVVLTSCEDIDGKQTPIKLDKSELTLHQLVESKWLLLLITRVGG